MREPITQDLIKEGINEGKKNFIYFFLKANLDLC